MKKMLNGLAGLAATVLFVGCQTPLPPGAERGPHNTMAYEVLIEASDPGARIEANGQDIGNTPIRLKIFGDPDGTFHDFGSEYYEIRALPLSTNQFAQARFFGTGQWLGPEDQIPDKIYFNMNQPPPSPPPYPPPSYYGPSPYWYPPPYYYGPGFYFGPSYYHYHHHHHWH